MRIKESKLRRIIRNYIVENYDGLGRPNWDNEEKLRKAGKFDGMGNISKSDEEEAAAHIRYRDDLGRANDRKRAEIEKAKLDREERKRQRLKDVEDFMSGMSESRRYRSQRIIREHLHGYKGSYKEPYMVREIPPEAKQVEWFGEWKEEFDLTKEAIEGNYRKMTNLSIDFPKMNTNNVDEDAMDLKHYHQMSATEKYVYCKNELMYLWEDLKRLWQELDDELGIEDGFASFGLGDKLF